MPPGARGAFTPREKQAFRAFPCFVPQGNIYCDWTSKVGSYMGIRVGFVWALAAILFAGCVGASGDGANIDKETGNELVTVSGLVISDELFPIFEADIRLQPLNLTTFTDEGGRFTFLEIPLGEYVLNTSAPNYESASLELEVSGPLDAVKVSLKGIPGKAPYVETIPFTGFDICNFSAVYSAGPIPGAFGLDCPLGEGVTNTKVEVGTHWAAGVFELDWETSDTMIFAASVATEDSTQDRGPGCNSSGASHDWCPAMLWGQAPLKILARPNDTEYAAKYAIDGKEMFPGGRNFTSWIFSSYSGLLQGEVNQTGYPVCSEFNAQVGFPRAWGCPFGVGYSTGVRIQYYHTTFYHQQPAGRLEDYSALPDA